MPATMTRLRSASAAAALAPDPPKSPATTGGFVMPGATRTPRTLPKPKHPPATPSSPSTTVPKCVDEPEMAPTPQTSTDALVLTPMSADETAPTPPQQISSDEPAPTPPQQISSDEPAPTQTPTTAASANQATVNEEAQKQLFECYRRMEERVKQLEEDEKRMKAEIRDLRDKLEEEEWARKNLEKKIEENGWSSVEENRGEIAEGWRKELREAEERIVKKVKEEQKVKKKKMKCIVFTDSNGRNATTPSSIKYHILEEERDDYEVDVVIAYRVEEACSIVEKGDLGIAGATILIDCHNNDARLTRKAPALSPDELAIAVDKLRKKLWDAGANSVIVCSLKPTERANVSEHDDSIRRYLEGMREVDGGYGCHTQVRLEHLRGDGLHILPRFYYVLQQTYAFALMGKYVPDPTPRECLTPYHVRQAFRREWPLPLSRRDRVVRAPQTNHGGDR